jgi:hypothetical protein
LCAVVVVCGVVLGWRSLTVLYYVAKICSRGGGMLPCMCLRLRRCCFDVGLLDRFAMILFNSARESDGLIVMRLFPQLDCTLRIIGGIPFYYCYSLSSIRVYGLRSVRCQGKLKRELFLGDLFPRPGRAEQA